MKIFFIPYHLVEFIISKENDRYRHGLAWRLYFYICHEMSGRFKYDRRSELVQTFKSSHTAIKNSLNYLQSQGFLKIEKGWVEAKSEKRLRPLTQSPNKKLKFEIKSETLLNRTKFYNYCFTIIYQYSAMTKGKNSKTIEGYLIGRKMDRAKETPLNNKVRYEGFIQKQSCTYQAKMTNRNHITAYKRMRSIIKDNNIFSPECMVYFHYKVHTKKEYQLPGSTPEAQRFITTTLKGNGWIKNNSILTQTPFFYSYMIPFISPNDF